MGNYHTPPSEPAICYECNEFSEEEYNELESRYESQYPPEKRLTKDIPDYEEYYAMICGKYDPEHIHCISCKKLIPTTEAYYVTCFQETAYACSSECHKKAVEMEEQNRLEEQRTEEEWLKGEKS